MLGVVCQGRLAFGQVFFDAMSESMGRSGRAAIGAINSHFLNPAGLPFSKGYTLGGVYKEERGGKENPANTYGVVIVDNGPDSPMTGGLSYIYNRKSQPDKTVTDQDFLLSFGGKIKQTISLGIQGHRLVRRDDHGPGFEKHNIGFGALFVPKAFLGFSFVAYDVLKDDDLDMIPVLGFGTNLVILDVVRVTADITKPQKKNPNDEGVLGMGVEFNGEYGLKFRAGGQWDQVAKERFVSLGFGFDGPKLSLGYAYRKNIDVAYDAGHTIQAWLVF